VFNLQRIISVVGLGMMAATLPLLTGCGGGGSPLVNIILGYMVGDQQTTPDTGLTIRLINAGGEGEEELDLLVAYQTEGDQNGDGIRVESVTIECTAEEAACEEFLDDCPIRVEALEERRRDDQGRLLGSRDLSGINDFTFEEGEFNCGSFINFTFSEIQAQAEAY